MANVGEGGGSGSDTTTIDTSRQFDSQSSVAPYLILKDDLRRDGKHLYRLPLIPLQISFGIVQELSHKRITLQEAVRKDLKKSQTSVTL